MSWNAGGLRSTMTSESVNIIYVSFSSEEFRIIERLAGVQAVPEYLRTVVLGVINDPIKDKSRRE